MSIKLKNYQVDSFTDQLFHGNPACVVPMDEWLSDEVLLNIAKENAVAETAYFVPTGSGFHLRWFTPEIEMDLCGHATLATAFILKNVLDYIGNEITFESASGKLIVTEKDGLLSMDFPSRKPVKAEMPAALVDSLNIQPQEVYKARDFMLVYSSEKEVRDIKINTGPFNTLDLEPGGVIVTAKGESCDFVSRFFCPGASIMEDPVTGSTHCTLTPYWSEILKKDKLNAEQVSARHGKLTCEQKGDRVIISGHARLYSEGHIWID